MVPSKKLNRSSQFRANLRGNQGERQTENSLEMDIDRVRSGNRNDRPASWQGIQRGDDLGR